MKKNIRRVAGVIFLALAIALSQVPASFVEAISTGSNFKMDGDTLISYTGTASAVSVPAGTRKIATDAFAGNQFLKEICFPDSLTTIQNGAFRDCSSIEELVFPHGLETIESGAFSMCDSLSRVEFSDTILNLGAGVFSGDHKLRTVILGDNPNFSVYNGALYNKRQTKLIQVFAGRKGEAFIMPSTVTDIERYAFWGCKNLESVTLSSYLDTIPEYAFSNCENLNSISIPYSVRTIAAKAFEDCMSLEYMFLPASVTNIHNTAFDGCYQLTLDAQEGTHAYEFAHGFAVSMASLMEEDDGISSNSIGDVYRDVKRGSSPTKDTFTEGTAEKEDIDDGFDPSKPGDVSKLDVSKYYGQDTEDLIGKTRVVGGNAVVFYGGAESISVQNGTSTNESLKSETFAPDFVVRDNNVHTVSRKNHYKDDSLHKVEIEKGIERIDDFAFSRSTVTELLIPEGVTHIGYGAFYHCDNLVKIHIPATVTSIEPEAFAETPYFSDWKEEISGEDFLVVGDGILIAYKGNASRVYLPEGVKKIAGGVFKNHPEITYIYIGDSVSEIGEDAFFGCTSLGEIDGGKNLEKICDRAFALCPLLSIRIPAGVREIGLGAFKLAASDAVIFESKEGLPAVSYEKTATRLENEGYRSLAFSDVDTFVIDNYNIELDNTVADEKYMGFRGLVVTPDGRENADSVVLVSCSLLPNEATGLVEVPTSVRINGKNYSITRALSNAFSTYATYEYWGETPMKGILLPPALGKISDYTPELTFTETEKINSVTTIVLDDSYGNAASIRGSVIDDDAQYLLYVDHNMESIKQLEAAVEAEYGDLVNGQLNTFDLTMVEMKSGVPISNFGDTGVELRIPISEMLMKQDICAVTLNEEGRLQTIYGTKQTDEDGSCFVFKTNHFSTYGIYAGIGEMAEKIELESQRLLKKDVTPDTGEAFNPKWLLAIFCGLTGLVLLINRPYFIRDFKVKQDNF